MGEYKASSCLLDLLFIDLSNWE